MAELSGFWTTEDTTPVGHQVASYTDVIASTAWRIIAACAGHQGVAPGFLNELVGSVQGANTVRIGTGAALVDGQWYINDSPQDINIPSAVGAGNTRIDRLVVRITWANYEAALTRIAGVDAASPTAPALVQNSGVVYDLPLYQVLVDTSGTVTLTDERLIAQVGTSGIKDNAVTNGKLDDDAVTPAKLDETGAYTVQSITTVTPGANAVRVRKTGDTQDRVTLHTGGIILFGPGNALPDVNLYRKDGNTLATGDSLEVGGDLDVGGDLEVGGTVAGINLATHDHAGGDGEQIPTGGLADGAVDTAKLKDGALAANTAGRAKMSNGYITAEKLANDVVDDTKVGNRVPALVRRVGGDPTMWIAAGTTPYTPGAVRMVAGVTRSSGGGDVTAPFGITFASQPILIASTYGITPTCIEVSVFADSFFLSVYDIDGNRVHAAEVYWLAIGPE